ncbi:DUF3560 domain-containing protein [Streptomyces sp. NPDC058595]|uniref:DUF3560 domain-containing protein n=1 Tax=Streptomyces sp. NPDC058595 TaxID=3346550 RepID=UPI003658C075
MTLITISHTPATGTLVLGTEPGDGAAAVLKRHAYGPANSRRWEYSRRLGCWYLPFTRDKEADSRSIDKLAVALRERRFTVAVRVDESEQRSFADAEKERLTRAAERAGRFGTYAANAHRNSDELYRKARRMARTIPPDQPILVDHYSAGREINFRKRIRRTFDKSFSEEARGKDWDRRSDGAAAHAAHRQDPTAALRRIARLEADGLRWTRELENDGITAERRSQAEKQMAKVDEQLAYWREFVREAERGGFKEWSADDFTKGDFVQHGGTWYEVLRVNSKSLTVPVALRRQSVLTRASSDLPARTGRLPYDTVTGRRSAQEMAAGSTQSP